MAAKIVSRGDPIEPIYLNNLRVAARGWGVVSGLAVSQKGAGANMSVDIATGEAWINGTKVTKGSITNVVITAAHASYDRYDLVVINSSGTISVIDGTAAAVSYANDYDLQANNAILLSEVYVPATDTTIEDAQITDKQIISFIELINVANGIAGLDASAEIIARLNYEGVANGIPVLDGSALIPTIILQADVAVIARGSYTGNGGTNLAIPHGLGVTPKAVFSVRQNDGLNSIGMANGKWGSNYSNTTTLVTTTAMDSTNFYVSGNVNGNSDVYEYVVIA